MGFAATVAHDLGLAGDEVASLFASINALAVQLDNATPAPQYVPSPTTPEDAVRLFIAKLGGA